jgi:GT2 family glycosyltransferase
MCTYVILLNWNGWKDTIECLESVFRLDDPDFHVVVCDNASEDGSLEKIKQWARGEVIAQFPIAQSSGFTATPIAKPVPYLELDRTQTGSATRHDNRFVLIQTGANLGFAGGNNVGIRYALRDPDCKFIWLLNNDTVVESNALSELIAKARTDPRIGAVGSVCRYADAPSIVQAWAGARVNLWIGFARNSTVPRPDNWFHALYGASMLLPREAILQTGLLDEGFFFGWEETEFCIRLRKGGWRLAAAPDSRVLHKVSASIGANSPVIDRYFTASGLRILRLHSPVPHLAMTSFLVMRLLRRLLRANLSQCASVWRGLRDYRHTLPITPGIQMVYAPGPGAPGPSAGPTIGPTTGPSNG